MDTARHSRHHGIAAIAMDPSCRNDTCRACANPRGERRSSARHRTWRRFDRDRGLTLVEVALILGIIGVLTSLAFTTYQGYRERLKLDKAVGDVMVISLSVTEFNAEYKRLPTDLAEVGKGGMVDPWGNAYQYVNHTTASPGQFRKDKNIVPINSDFDLYSKGKDGASVAPLTAAHSRDDIIRANDGAFIGLASVYDP